MAALSASHIKANRPLPKGLLVLLGLDRARVGTIKARFYGAVGGAVSDPSC